MRHRFAPSPEWSLAYEDGLLVAHAGADLLYAVEDVDADTASRITALWGAGEIDANALPERARDVVVQLATAGVLERGLPGGPPRRFAVAVAGDRMPALEQRLRAETAETDSLDLVSSAEADLVLYVRTNARLADLYELEPPPEVPHLLVDAGLHHTLSLGPLVFMGETACLACLVGRLNHYWGDAVPPPKPRALRKPSIVAALAVHELERVAGGEHGLANTTVAYDLERHRVTRASVYKLPWCPVCGMQDARDPAPMDLPWSAAA